MRRPAFCVGWCSALVAVLRCPVAPLRCLVFCAAARLVASRWSSAATPQPAIALSRRPSQQLLPDAAALSSMQGPPRSGNSSAQTSASLHPPAALRLRCLPFTGHGRPRSVRKSSRLRWKCLSMDCICSDRRKSFGPSAPIAYATSVSPPDEAAAWPWAQVSDR